MTFLVVGLPAIFQIVQSCILLNSCVDSVYLDLLFVYYKRQNFCGFRKFSINREKISLLISIHECCFCPYLEKFSLHYE